MPFSANYLAAAAKRKIQANYYVVFSGIATKFSKFTVSGLASYEKGLVSIEFNPSKISLDNVQTSVGSLSFKLFDPNETFITALQTVQILEQTVSVYIGFADIAVADYRKIADYRIEKVSYDGKFYSISANDTVKDLIAPVKFVSSSLTADVSAAATTFSMLSVAAFGATGTGKIGRETVTWTGKTGSVPGTLTGVTRGASGSEADTHKSGDEVFQIETLETNPITALLQLIISPGGGGTYDVLSYGLGLSQSRLNVTSFENARDNSDLASDTWSFKFSEDIPDFLKFAEKDLLFFLNGRIYSDIDGKLSFTLVERITIDTLGGLLEREDLIKVPTSNMDSKRLYNRVTIKWDWDEGREAFQRELVYNDTDSQGRYGIIEFKTKAESKGIKQALNGQAIVDNFAERLLRRVAFPVNRFDGVETLWNKQEFDISQKIQLVDDRASNLATGERGVSQIAEVMDKKWDFDKGTVKFGTNASELLSERWFFISAASGVASAASASVFTLETGQGVKWTAGWKIALWDRFGGSGPISTKEILSVVGDVITLVSAFSSTPTVNHQIVFADYDDVAEVQKIYGWVSPNAGNFGDGKGPYLISD